jgi:DNA-binding transcriptional LysR family regulator
MICGVAITLTQLRSFLAVVRAGSVGGAADALVVTQPSVSAAVAALAREVGTDLLERDGRGVRPTAAGAAFASFAADVVGLLDQGVRAAREEGAAAGRELRVAAVTTAAESFVPGLLQAFGQAHPDVRVTLAVGNRSHVFQLLADHAADVAFGGRPPRDAGLEALPILPNELALITRPGDELAARSAVAPRELTGRTWLMREPGSGTRAVNDAFLAEHDLAPAQLTVGSNGAIKQAARAGLGIALLSRDAVADELEAGLLGRIPITGPRTRMWHLMWPATGPRRPVVDELIALSRRAGAG